jgi:hypothetical protein
MKKTFTLLSALFLGWSISAQVAVTFQVDVSSYVSGGNTIDPSGIRFAGNFSARQATAGGTPMADWSPTVANSALTSIGNNIWQGVVTFPNNMIGQELNFIYVNGNFGMQEGTDPMSTIISSNCGETATILGTPLTVRSFIIPQTATTFRKCWDKCTYACNGSAAGVENQTISALTISPNPMNDVAVFSFTSNVEHVTVSILDLTGKVVAAKDVAAQMENNVEIATGHLLAGAYIYQVNAGGMMYSGMVVKN